MIAAPGRARRGGEPEPEPPLRSEVARLRRRIDLHLPPRRRTDHSPRPLRRSTDSRNSAAPGAREGEAVAHGADAGAAHVGDGLLQVLHLLLQLLDLEGFLLQHRERFWIDLLLLRLRHWEDELERRDPFWEDANEKLERCITDTAVLITRLRFRVLRLER